MHARSKLTKFFISIITLLLVFTMMPALFFDAVTPIYAEDSASGIENIQRFTATFTRGAEEKDGKYVWTPTSASDKTRAVYSLHYAFSGSGSAKPGDIRILVPKHIFKDRDGNYADEFDCGVPKDTEADSSDDFMYKEGTGDEKDYYIITNNTSIPANQSGNIEVSYTPTRSTAQYKDMEASDTFKAKMTVKKSSDDLTKEAEADPVYIDTNTVISNISISTSDDTDIYTSWQDDWGDKPSDASDYYYLIFDVRANFKLPIAAKYNYTLTANAENCTVAGYRFSGKTFTAENTDKAASPSSNRSDQVLVKIKKNDYLGKDAVTVKLSVTATAEPVDEKDGSTNAKSSYSWTFEKEGFSAPAIGIGIFGFGLFSGISTADASQKDRYTNDYYGHKGRKTISVTSQDIADYSLDDFKSGKEITDLRFINYTDGHIAKLTVPKGEDTSNPKNYGKCSVNMSVESGDVKISPNATDKGTVLNSDDYDISSVSFLLYAKNYEYNELRDNFVETNQKFNSDDSVTFYAKKDGAFVKAAEYSPLTSTYSYINNTIVSSANSQAIFFNDGVKGYRISATGKHMYGCIDAYPSLTIKNTANTRAIVGSSTKIGVSLGVHGEVGRAGEKAIYTKDTEGTDYVMGIKTESGLFKSLNGTKNNKKKKEYTATWRVLADNAYREADGRRQVTQNGGTFYDLVPEGAEPDLDSIVVRSGGEELPPSDYTVTTKEDYKGSGRTLVIIKISKAGTGYSFTMDTVHPWNNLKETKFKLYNSVAYETGNDSIVNGSTDTGGSGKDSEYLKGLDPDSAGNRFLYAYESRTADLVTTSSTGFTVKAKGPRESEYSDTATTYPVNTYAYRLRITTGDNAKQTGLVFFDSLENAKSAEGIPSGWKGTLQSVNLQSLKNMGVSPTIYYSSVEGLDPAAHTDFSELDSKGEKIWKTADEFGNISKAKAVAIDCSRGTDGKAFTLDKDSSLHVDLFLTAPAKVPDASATAYNSASVKRTLVTETGTEDPEVVTQGPAAVNLKAAGDLTVRKVQSDNTNKTISGIKFRLYGTSVYLDDIDKTLTTGSQGTVTFSKIPKGTYTLQEIGGLSDWQVDRNDKTVSVDDTGLVTVSDLTTENGVYIFPDKERAHADVHLTVRSKEKSKDAKDAMEAIKNAGENGKVSVDGEIFTVNSISANSAVLKPSKEVTSDMKTVNELLLKTNDDGTITVSLRDGVSHLIPNSSYHLSGTSDYGNEVSMDETSGNTGKLTFSNVEQGTYTLQETKANDDYILDAAEYKVKVDNNGVVSIENAEDDGFQNFTLRNEPKYHDFSIRKVDKENPSNWLSGAGFRLQGVSELGTSVDKTVTTDDTGLAEFLDVEKGTYILTETKAPANHKLDPKSHVVKVTAYGDILCEDLSVDSDEHLQYPNERSLDGKITITKKWADTGKSDSDRPVPKIYISSKNPEESAMSKASLVSFPAKAMISPVRKSVLRMAANTTLTGQAYAVYDSTDQSMTFFRDTAGKYTDGQVDGAKTYYTGFENITSQTVPSWVNSSRTQKNVIKTVVFKDKIQPKVCYAWFSYATSLTAVENSQNLDMSKCINPREMFEYCSKLTSIDVSGWDMSSANNIDSMFNSCASLQALDVSNWNVGKVVNMASAFAGCASIKTLDVSKWNTSSLQYMTSTFGSCSQLESLDLTSWDVSKVKYMTLAFSGDTALKTLDLSTWNPAALKHISNMFRNSGITTLILGEKWTKQTENSQLDGNWNRIAATSGRKVAKTAAVSGSALFSNYNGTTMAGIWQKEGTPESASPVDVYEEYDSDDSKWVKNGDGTWTYTFDVYDDTAKFYAYEDDLTGYTSSNGKDNPLVINDGTVTKSGTITNTESDYGSLKVSKTVTGDDLTVSDKSKTFGFTIKLSGSSISGMQSFSGVVFTDGIAKIALSDGQSKTFTNLPAGTAYTVTEDPTTDYTSTVTGGTGTVSASTENDASVVNTKNVDKSKLTDVTITKALNGNDTNPDDAFTFTVELEGLKPNETYSLEDKKPVLKIESKAVTKANDGLVLNGVMGDVFLDGEKVSLTSNSGKEYTYTLPDGTVLTVTITGSRTTPGTSSNTFTYAFSPESAADNYDVQTEYGKLTVESADPGILSAKAASVQNTSGKALAEEPVTFTADASGHAKVTFTMKGGSRKVLKNLPDGAKYRVTESANAYTPSFVISNADANGTIRQDTGSSSKAESLSTVFETVEHNEKSTVAFTNTRNKDTSDTQDLVLVKKASDSSGNPTDMVLSNAWFTLQGTSDDGEEIDVRKESDSEGKITFEKLSKGSYTLTETQAPTGYQKDDTKRTVIVDPDKEPAVTVTGLTEGKDGTFSVYNQPVPTYKVSLNFKDEGSSKPIENAELELYDNDGNRVAKWTTMHTAADDAMYAYDDGTKYEYGHFMNLPEGTYTLKATSVPEPYTKPDDLTFTVGSSGKVTSSAKDAVTEKSNIADPTSSTGEATMSFTEVSMTSSSGISGLPLTGGMGTKLLYFLGAALIAIGVATYLKKKKGGK